MGSKVAAVIEILKVTVAAIFLEHFRGTATGCFSGTSCSCAPKMWPEENDDNRTTTRWGAVQQTVNKLVMT